MNPKIKPRMIRDEVRLAYAKAEALFLALGLPPLAAQYAELSALAKRDGTELPPLLEMGAQ